MTLRLLYRGPTIEVLHEQYAKQGHTDARAPVHAAHTVHIGATPQRVWEVLSAAAEWPSVDPAISNVPTRGRPSFCTAFCASLAADRHRDQRVGRPPTLLHLARGPSGPDHEVAARRLVEFRIGFSRLASLPPTTTTQRDQPVRRVRASERVDEPR